MDWKVADVQSWLTAIELPQHAGVLSHLHGGGGTRSCKCPRAWWFCFVVTW
jgi:hypothetical protein